MWMNYLAFDNSYLPSPFNIIEALIKCSCRCKEERNVQPMTDREEYFALLEKLTNKYITREEDVELRDITVEDVTNARNEIISQYLHHHNKIKFRSEETEDAVSDISLEKVDEEKESEETDLDSDIET